MEFRKKIGRVTINLSAIPMGEDLCVVITGGDRPHLGAVGLSVPRKSLADPSCTSASTSVLTLTGHKEDEIVKALSQLLASELNKNVVVACGIHIDNITKAEISSINEMLKIMIDDMIKQFKSELMF